MKILITGTYGFIGKNILNKFKNYNILEINEDIFLHKTWEKKLVSKLNKFKPTVIFHVGACSNTLETNINHIMEMNFQFTKILVDWSNINNSKLIYSSSAANYGINKSYPSNLYGWSKYTAEQYVISNNYVALRYFNVYGPGEENKGLMASMIYQSYNKHINNKIVELFPQKPTRDFVYIEDVVNANLHALNNYEKCCGKYFEVGSGESKSFEKILEFMKINYIYTDIKKIPVGYQFYTISNKSKWMPDWKPKFKLEDGLSEYIKYLNNF